MSKKVYRLWREAELLSEFGSDVSARFSTPPVVTESVIAQLSGRFSEEFRALIFGMVSPYDDYPAQNPFKSGGPSWDGSARHIGIHCMTVALVAREICMRFGGGSSGAPAQLLDEVTKVGLLHDSLKRLELLWYWAGSGEGLSPDAARSRMLSDVNKYLIAAGCPAELIERMMAATQLASDENILSLAVVTEEGEVKLRSGSLVAKYVLLSDAMTATNFSPEGRYGVTRVLTPYERLRYTNYLKRNPTSPHAVCVSSSGEVVLRSSSTQGEDVTPLASSDRFFTWLANAIAGELVQLAGDSVGGRVAPSDCPAEVKATVYARLPIFAIES